MLWLIGPEGVECYDQLRAETPCEISKEFMSGGYFVMRDGWRRNSSFVLINCGPHGADTGCGHAHADALSIEFASRGVSWIVNPGAYVYAADPKTRDEFRSTAAHNTVTVDDQSQSVASTPFSWRTAAKCRLHGFIERGDAIFFQGSHDGYERLKDPVKHTRSVLFVKPNAHADLPEYLIVRDQFTANKRHRYAIRYHLTPDCEASPGAEPRRGPPRERRRADYQSHLRDWRQNRNNRRSVCRGACQSRGQSCRRLGLDLLRAIRPRARRPVRGRGRRDAGISDPDLPRRLRSGRGLRKTDSQSMVEDHGSGIEDQMGLIGFMGSITIGPIGFMRPRGPMSPISPSKRAW